MAASAASRASAASCFLSPQVGVLLFCLAAGRRSLLLASPLIWDPEDIVVILHALVPLYRGLSSRFRRLAPRLPELRRIDHHAFGLHRFHQPGKGSLGPESALAQRRPCSSCR